MSLKINHITNTLQVDDSAASANIVLVPKGAGFVDLSASTATSNATNTGALVVGGGIGVGGSITVGGSLTVAGGISASISGVSTTATNVGGGSAGQLHIQSAPGVTTFIPAGTDGYLLQYQTGNTASFVSTTTMIVGYATIATNLSGGSVNATTGVFSGITTVTNATAATSTSTGALRVTGGVGIGGNVFVGGTVTATNLFVGPWPVSTSTGATATWPVTNTTGASGPLSVAIGQNANAASQSISIGNNAGNSGQGGDAVAIGDYAGSTTQGNNAIAIGKLAGQQNQSGDTIAIGDSAGRSSQGNNAIAIGKLAGSSSQPANSIIFNASGSALESANAGFYVAPIRADITSSGTSIVVFYNPTTKELTTSSTGIIAGSAGTATNIASGSAGQILMQNAAGSTTFIPSGAAGTLLQASAGNTSTFVSTTTLQVGYATIATNLSGGSVNATTGVFSGITTVTNATVSTSTNTGALRIAGGVGVGGSLYVGGTVTATNLFVGPWPVSTSTGATATWPVTNTTGASGPLSVAIGQSANAGAQGISLGYFAGNNNQGTYAVAIGSQAGQGSQGVSSVAVGGNAGNNNQNAYSVAVGGSAGNSNQGQQSVAVGYNAGNNNQNAYSVAVGVNAGATNQQQQAVAVGYNAGNGGQVAYAVAVGAQAGNINQQQQAVAVGYQAGNSGQGTYAVAIGAQAGLSNQPSGSIIINANATALNGSNAGLYIDPVRNDTGNNTNVVYYNATTKELTYTTAGLAGSTTNLANGGAGQIPIQNAAGSTTFIPSGAAGTVLQAQTSNTATWVSTGTMFVGNALNIVGGSAGQIHMQNAAGVTTFIPAGSTGTILQAGSSNTATFVSTATIRVGYSDTATNATNSSNIIGGAAGQIHMQNAAGVTTFISTGTVGYVLTMGANSTASWAASAGLSAGNSTTATNIANGSAGQIPIQTAAGLTSFIPTGTAGTILQAGAGSTATFVSTGSIRVGYADYANTAGSAGSATSAGLATAIANGKNGEMPIQTSAGVTTFIPAGTSGQVLVYGTNTATWTTAVGNATNATNLSGGAQYQIPYQSGVGATAFSANLEFDGNSLFVNVGSATQLNTGYTNRLNVSGGIVAGTAASTNGSIILQGLYGANGAITNFGTEYSTGGPVLGYGVYPSGVSSGAFLSSGPAALSRGAYTISGNVHNWYIGGSQTTAIGNPVTMTLAMTLTATGALAFSGASNYGSSGYVLQSNGNSAPTWVALSGVSSGSASVANNIAGGSANQIPYQSGAGSTSFTANLTWDGSNLKVNTSNVLTVASAASTGLTAYDISNFINGKPLSGEVIMRALMVRSCSFAGNFAGSYASAGTAPSAAAGVSMIIYKQGVAIGTLTFAQNSTSGVFATTGGTAVSFIAGNQLVIQVDNSVNGQDPSFSDMALTLFGTVAV